MFKRDISIRSHFGRDYQRMKSFKRSLQGFVRFNRRWKMFNWVLSPLLPLCSHIHHLVRNRKNWTKQNNRSQFSNYYYYIFIFRSFHWLLCLIIGSYFSFVISFCSVNGFVFCFVNDFPLQTEEKNVMVVIPKIFNTKLDLNFFIVRSKVWSFAIDRGRNIEKMRPFDAIIDTIMCKYVRKLTGQAPLNFYWRSITLWVFPP